MVAAVSVAWAGTALAASSTGTLEICKASLNGMSGKTFQYSVNGGSAITVKGGRCSGPITVASGSATILEAQSSPATEVAAVRVSPSSRLVSTDLPNRKAVVTVLAGTTAANETRVTFINQPAGGNKGDLKICKLSETPAFWGKQFSFTVNGGPAISTEANPTFDDPSTWSCRLAGTFQVGSNVTIQELIPSGAEVAFIDSDPSDRLTDFDTEAGTAQVTIGTGTTIVTYDNEAPTVQGQGYLEICKDRARIEDGELDYDVQGSFHYTITDAAGDEQEVDVLVGQCSAPLLVAAGVADVQEELQPGIELVDTFTVPEDRWLGDNLINGNAQVEVPVSEDSNDETQVHFVNKRQRAQLKVCKALGPGSADLIGRTFQFDIHADGDPESSDEDTVRIRAAASTQCKIVDNYPIGAELVVTEDLSQLEDSLYIKASGPATCAYEDPEDIDRSGDFACPITIRPGINTVTITNTALGKIEICKFVKDVERGDNTPLTGDEAKKTFSFHLDGGPAIKLRAGMCTVPKLVSVGPHTVKEDAELNYNLVDIDVTPESAEVSENLTGRTVTVNVPFAGDLPDVPGVDEDQLGQEVRVDFYNQVKTFQIKVCKHITSGSSDVLGTTPFDFTVKVPGEDDTFYLTLRQGECQLVTENGRPENFPVILPDGTPNNYTVEETSNAKWTVYSTAVQGARSWYWRGNVVYVEPGPNTNTVHFTNKAVDP